MVLRQHRDHRAAPLGPRTHLDGGGIQVGRRRSSSGAPHVEPQGEHQRRIQAGLTPTDYNLNFVLLRPIAAFQALHIRRSALDRQDSRLLTCGANLRFSRRIEGLQRWPNPARLRHAVDQSRAEASPAAPPRRAARFGWALAAVVLTAFRNRRPRQHGDRSARRSPDHRTSTPGTPPYPPFLGVTNWPLVTSVTSVVLTVGFFGYLGMAVGPQAQPALVVDRRIAAFFAGALDPLANWATFTVFDPRVAHFPLSWPYFNASPLLEPTLSFLGGYASYYVLTGRPALDPSTVHRTAYPSQQLARRHRLSPSSSPDSLRAFPSTRSCNSCG